MSSSIEHIVMIKIKLVDVGSGLVALKLLEFHSHKNKPLQISRLNQIYYYFVQLFFHFFFSDERELTKIFFSLFNTINNYFFVPRSRVSTITCIATTECNLFQNDFDF